MSVWAAMLLLSSAVTDQAEEAIGTSAQPATGALVVQERANDRAARRRPRPPRVGPRFVPKPPDANDFSKPEDYRQSLEDYRKRLEVWQLRQGPEVQAQYREVLKGYRGGIVTYRSRATRIQHGRE